jgi:hypothetical protein
MFYLLSSSSIFYPPSSILFLLASPELHILVDVNVYPKSE